VRALDAWIHERKHLEKGALRMQRAIVRSFLSALAVALIWSPALGHADTVRIRFDPDLPTAGIFPSNRFTVLDVRQETRRRVNLPLPDCSARPDDCDDLDVLNQLDGFNLQPRVSIAFDGPIDVSSVTRDSIVFLNLGDRKADVIGVNQVVFDPDTNTLFAESDELLDQHTRYALIVTRKIRDADGKGIGRAGLLRAFRDDRSRPARDRLSLRSYREDLIRAQVRALRAGFRPSEVAGLSVFTTQSTTSFIEKVRRQLDAADAPAADFALGAAGEQTVFPLADVASVIFNRQVVVEGDLAPSPVAIQAFNIRPGAVGQIAFGRYSSPEFRNSDQFIDQIPTRIGRPKATGSNDVFFSMVLPAGPPPPQGWPIALYGHGFGGNKESIPVFSAILASRGIASVGINVPGHGGGASGTLAVRLRSGDVVTLPAGGRGIDQNGDGMIGGTEGFSTNPAAAQRTISSRDGLRQTVIDLMQLVRVLKAGVDVDQDGSRDFDPSRIYYFGMSLGGIYGTMLLGVESEIHAGVPNVPGGFFIDIARLGPAFRPAVGAALAVRTPSLINVGGPIGLDFDENVPLRNTPPIVNDVPGAPAIARFLDNAQWISNSGDPVTYAPHIRKDPLRGNRPKSVIVQFAKGDQIVVNPTASALIRAGGLTDRTSYLRNDLLFAMDPANTPTNPHGFLGNILNPRLGIAGQTQIAAFLESDGATVIDPDGPGPIFEVPIAGPLPETLNFIVVPPMLMAAP